MRRVIFYIVLGVSFVLAGASLATAEKPYSLIIILLLLVLQYLFATASTEFMDIKVAPLKVILTIFGVAVTAGAIYLWSIYWFTYPPMPYDWRNDVPWQSRLMAGSALLLYVVGQVGLWIEYIAHKSNETKWMALITGLVILAVVVLAAGVTSPYKGERIWGVFLQLAPRVPCPAVINDVLLSQTDASCPDEYLLRGR